MTFGVNVYIDAIIGLSGVYQGFESVAGCQRLAMAIDAKAVARVFGLFLVLGLATKVQDLEMSRDGRLANLFPSTGGGTRPGDRAVAGVYLFWLWRDRPHLTRYAFAAKRAADPGGPVARNLPDTGIPRQLIDQLPRLHFQAVLATFARHAVERTVTNSLAADAGEGIRWSALRQ
ncbi:HupE/UreJ family protein [Alteraurantiacibacter buctensis]|uniref:Uncharacterized protein n=1 Tax=Alteraurantiacibacter buctensis TaxID=1503981 RepID=A0A844YPF6_9SPHN|nr:HupE/UreJ family protein [Alteraurantiacibacter buctensis]MXO70265.1 hypothetical protein [Alteraurantiacibacter buctensis]